MRTSDDHDPLVNVGVLGHGSCLVDGIDCCEGPNSVRDIVGTVRKAGCHAGEHLQPQGQSAACTTVINSASTCTHLLAHLTACARNTHHAHGAAPAAAFPATPRMEFGGCAWPRQSCRQTRRQQAAARLQILESAFGAVLKHLSGVVHRARVLVLERRVWVVDVDGVLQPPEERRRLLFLLQLCTTNSKHCYRRAQGMQCMCMHSEVCCLQLPHQAVCRKAGLHKHSTLKL